MSAGDPFQPEDPGLLSSILGYLSLPGYAVRNLLKGNPLGALRNVGDLLGDTVDAVLPGDWIPEFSGKDDKPDATDVAEAWGAGKMDDGFLKGATNFIGDTLLDPLTYVGGGLVKGGLSAASKVLAKAGSAATGLNRVKDVATGLTSAGPAGRFLPELLATGANKTSDALDWFKNGEAGGVAASARAPITADDVLAALNRGTANVRSVFGADKLSPEVRDILDRNINAGALATKAQSGAAEAALASADPQAGADLFQAINNYTRGADGIAKRIVPKAEPVTPAAAASDVAETIPEDAYKQIAKTRMPVISKTTKDLGINGVADPNLEELQLHNALTKLHDAPMIEGLPVNDLTTGMPKRSKFKDISSLTGQESGALSNFLHAATDGDVVNAFAALGLRDLPKGLSAGDVAKLADQFADATKSQAYPRQLNARFESGIDQANRAHGVDVARKTFGAEKVTDLPTVNPVTGTPFSSAELAAMAETGPGQIARRSLRDDRAAAAELPLAPLPVRPQPFTDVSELLGRGGKEAGEAPLVRPPTSPVDIADILGKGGETPDVLKMLGGADAAAAPLTRIGDQLAEWQQRIKSLQLPAAREAAAMALAEKYAPLAQQSFADLVDRGAYYKPAGYAVSDGQGVFNPELQSPADYAARKFSGLTDEGDIPGVPMTGANDLSKARTLLTADDLVDFLNKNPAAKLDENLANVTLGRAGQHGQLVQSAGIARDLISSAAEKARAKLKDAPLVEEKPTYNPDTKTWSRPRDFDPATGIEQPQLVPDVSALSETEQAALKLDGKAFTEEGVKTLANSLIKEMAKTSPGDANRLDTAMNGLAPRGAFTNFLVKAAKPFKGPAVYGALIPKLGANMSNLTSGVEQALANQAARPSAGAIARVVLPAYFKSIDDGLSKVFGIRPLQTTNELAQIDDAFKASGGDVDRAINAIADVTDKTGKVVEKASTMQGAIREGVFSDGFVNKEQLIDQAQRTGWRKLFGNWWDMPGEMFRGGEQRLRYGLFKDLVENRGMSADEAGRTVADTFYNYSITSNGNRLARDIIPFFQFTAKAIPQQAKFLAGQTGRLGPETANGMLALGGPLSPAAALSSLWGGATGPVDPQMQGKANILIGHDDKGNPEYIAGTRLPFEALANVPNPSADLMDVGRQIEQGVVGASNPLLKTAYSAVTGRDPYFGGPAGTYSKVAGADLGGVGRAYNTLAGTGVVQPLDSVLKTIGTATGDKSAAAKVLSLLGGVSIASVDEDRALQRSLEAYLARNPQVGQYTSYYSTDPDAAELNGILKDLATTKAALKAKRKAEAAK